MSSFTGPGTPLSAQGFGAATGLNGIEAAALWSVLSVETSGCGYLADRRPKILFERHIFHRLTQGAYDASHPDLSAPSAGGYGPTGGHQYDRLAVANTLDRAAALQSASWGLGQVMGENYAAAGFTDEEAMVSAMVGAEDAQLRGMAAFIKANKMNLKLQAKDWAGFAKMYNGPNYAINNYDKLLAQNYSRFAAGPQPDLTIRAAQVYLTYKGYDVGGIDGVAGAKTTQSVKAFQGAHHYPVTGVINAALIQQLAA